jgi:hypothetical protein
MRYDGTPLRWMIPNLKAKLGTRKRRLGLLTGVRREINI